MNIFVTGCAGFIGSHLCEYLLNRGGSVTGLDNLNDFYDPDIKRENLRQIEATAKTSGQTFKFYLGDLREVEELSALLHDHKPGVIVHLAAMAGVRPSLEDPVEYVDVNERGTIILLEEARKAAVKNIVFGSSSSVYGNNKKVPFCESDAVDHPISPYAATKKAGELYCHIYHKIYAMNIACLRFFTVYGPRQRPDLAIHKFAKLMLRDVKIPVYGDGTKSRDFTYVDDIVQGIVAAIDWTLKPGAPRYDVFNLGESQTTDVNTLVALLETALGRPAKKERLDDMAGDVQTTFADITKAKEVLGYNPQTRIVDGINRFADWIINKRGA